MTSRIVLTRSKAKRIRASRSSRAYNSRLQDIFNILWVSSLESPSPKARASNLSREVKLVCPIDAGGEDKTRDFSNEINNCGPGKYCVIVRALSGNIDEVVNGTEGEMSDVLEISGAGQFAPAPSLIESRLAAAQSGSVVKITKEDNINTLSNADMKELLKRGDVALEMEYTYEGVDYRIYIPAGAAMDNDIPWYGPLYLAQYYSVNNAQAAGVTDYVVVRLGDTLGKIDRANGMTVNELAAKNPQIKNPNKIFSGQIIYIN